MVELQDKLKKLEESAGLVQRRQMYEAAAAYAILRDRMDMLDRLKNNYEVRLAVPPGCACCCACCIATCGACFCVRHSADWAVCHCHASSLEHQQKGIAARTCWPCDLHTSTDQCFVTCTAPATQKVAAPQKRGVYEAKLAEVRKRLDELRARQEELVGL